MSTRQILAALAAAFVLLPAAALGADTRIGYVDMQQAMDKSKAGQEAISLLNEKGKEFKEAEEKLKKKIEDARADLVNKAALLAPQERSRREEEITDDAREFERQVNDNRKKFAREQERMTEKIRQDLLEIIKKVGKDKGYTVILEKNFSAVLYAPKEIELTEEVLAEYDRTYKPKSLQ